MIVPPSGVRVWLATGATDMRRGMNSLALQVQESLHCDPHICVGLDYVSGSQKIALFHSNSQNRRHINVVSSASD
jgi:IS66 Orf2 like protein